MPEELVRIRDREGADLDLCVQALAAVHRMSGYPTNWPTDPAQWLTPSGIIRAWVATLDQLPIAGHLILRRIFHGAGGKLVAEVSRLFVVPTAQRKGVARALVQKAIQCAAANELDLVLEVTDHLQGARRLYEQAGFHLTDTRRADWATPDGQPVILHRYARKSLPGER